ncbi:hypothetical protein [Pseudonocardia sp. C8]|uniref:hypothetical protein n=1 Tax=Pseudonocardia sp. C8 TaxID=2762759 RepID=UPI001C92E056|nr:hypothetical protein [Pseudonocardia sp. C8]
MTWTDVERRYEGGAHIPTVAGGRTLHVTDVDDEGVHIRNPLWSDVLRRTDLEKAVELIDAGRMSRDAGRFVEEYRVMVADVRATSVAHVLKDLGVLE